MRVLIAALFAAFLAVNPSIAAAEGVVDVRDEGSGSFGGQARWKIKEVQDGIEKKPPKRSTGRTLTKTPIDDRLSKRRAAAFVVMCREATEAGRPCLTDPDPKRRPTAAQAVLDLDALARTLLTRIQLPSPVPRIGPDPAANEWRMAAVGYPLWLWTSGPATVVDRVRAYGVTFTLRARWVSTTFDMGDGHRVTCTRIQPYRPGVEPGSRSPHCGYTYEVASLPEGDYTVTATTNWTITWRALGLSGSMPASFAGTRQLPVGELNALVVR